jgi:hypothetical protein
MGVADFKKACDPVRRELLYNILIEFGVPTKLFRLIKMCLNKMYRKIHIGKHIQYSLSQGDALSPLLLNFSSGYVIRKVQDN